ncbi:MAG: maleylpyruvate isomerase N-terminal domain-containing protein [Chloroflexi bacterium]|nr:maleylpyruvate isomerase N-terminal domain-containing protein [Chloroflexota bacterium]
MTAKSDLLAELQSSHDSFRALFATLPAQAYGERWLGDWDLSQVLAHMAGWFREMAGSLERAARGERPTPEGVDYSDEDAWNARFAAKAKSGTAALADWDEAFAAYRAAAEALSDTLYGTDPERDRPRIGNRLLGGPGIHHFEEHRGQLEAWLASRK